MVDLSVLQMVEWLDVSKVASKVEQTVGTKGERLVEWKVELTAE
jgi:hypothetical protein